MSQICTDLDGCRPTDSVIFRILQIRPLVVILWHFSSRKVDFQITFPPPFLLVPEYRTISKFEPCLVLSHDQIHITMASVDSFNNC